MIAPRPEHLKGSETMGANSGNLDPTTRRSMTTGGAGSRLVC